MRIVFEQDQLFYYPRGGIAVYLYSLLRQLAASGKDALRLVHASARRRETVQLPGMPEGDIEVKRLLLPGRLTGMLPWPGAVEQVFLRQADLFHAISGVLPPWYRHYHPLVITVHDMVQFRDSGQDQTNMSGARYCTAIRRATELADQIVTVSEFTKRELCDILPVNPEKVTAIPIASQFSPSDFARMQPELPLLKGQRYFLAVSVLSPRKNYQTLLTAWERFAASGPDCRLVVVGRAGWHCDAIVSR